MRSIPAATAVLVVFALAGCFGGGASGGPRATDPTSATDAPGRVSGIVVNEEFLPVPAADVAIQGLGLATKTNPEGLFTLVGINSGAHVLDVAAVGYKPFSDDVLVTEEPIEDLEVRLVAVPNPAQPRHKSLIDQAFMSCNATTGSAYETYYTQFCGADPNNDPAFVFPVETGAGLASVVLEMEWTPTTNVNGKELRQALWNNIVCEGIRCHPESFDTDVFGETQGESPIKGVYGNLSRPLYPGNDPSGETTLVAIALVKNAPSLTTNPGEYVSVVFQQPVKHYVTMFYNSEPAPDFTALTA